MSRRRVIFYLFCVLYKIALQEKIKHGFPPNSAMCIKSSVVHNIPIIMQQMWPLLSFI